MPVTTYLPAVQRPASIDAAVAALAADGAVALAGGTDLMNQIRLGHRAPSCVVDLGDVADLRRLELAAGTVTIGAGVTVRQLLRDGRMASAAPALVDAGRLLGGRQIQAMATVGGNLCNASPAAELATPLLVHAATAAVHDAAGATEMPLTGFWSGPGRTVLRPGALLTELRIEALAASEGSAYQRLQLRRSVDIALVSASAWVRVADGRVVAARVAVGAAAPTPLIVDAAEEPLVGVPIDGELDQAIRAAGDLAAGAASPITDLRASDGYRREMVGVVVGRSLRAAIDRATAAG